MSLVRSLLSPCTSFGYRLELMSCFHLFLLGRFCWPHFEMILVRRSSWCLAIVLNCTHDPVDAKLWLLFFCFVVLWHAADRVVAVDVARPGFLLLAVLWLAVGVVEFVVCVNVVVLGVCGNTVFVFLSVWMIILIIILCVVWSLCFNSSVWCHRCVEEFLPVIQWYLGVFNSCRWPVMCANVHGRDIRFSVQVEKISMFTP